MLPTDIGCYNEELIDIFITLAVKLILLDLESYSQFCPNCNYTYYHCLCWNENYERKILAMIPITEQETAEDLGDRHVVIFVPVAFPLLTTVNSNA